MSTVNTRYESRKHPTDKNKFIVMDHKAGLAKEFTLREHMVYIRMCERKEKIGSIYLPQKSRDNHCTLWEVIAIGEKVSEYRPKEKRFDGVRDMDRNAVIDFNVGDTIIIPEKATGDGHGYQYFVRRSSISLYEGYIDKGLVLAKIP